MMMASVKIHASIDGHSLSQSLKFSLRRHLKLDDPRWITLSSTYIDISSNCLLWDMKQTSDRYPFQKGAFSPQWRIEEQCMRNKGLKLLELQQIARQWEEEVKSKESLISLFNLWMKAKATNKTDWNDPSVLRKRKKFPKNQSKEEESLPRKTIKEETKSLEDVRKMSSKES
ncbi:hypothetical protein Tco_1409214 [Tanacetum coccineum]